jgi:hypothetical protein
LCTRQGTHLSSFLFFPREFKVGKKRNKTLPQKNTADPLPYQEISTQLALLSLVTPNKLTAMLLMNPMLNFFFEPACFRAK